MNDLPCFVPITVHESFLDICGQNWVHTAFIVSSNSCLSDDVMLGN